MWSYYGAKTNIIDLYPAPVHEKIIEPFAGTARYALKYWEKDVLLVDKYPVITEIWKWLQQCSEQDILSLPRFKAGENINNHVYDCDAQRYLVGFLVGFGFIHPRKIATPRARHRPNQQNYTIKKIASQLFKIRHWKIMEGCYDEIPNQVVTWFIDPPYTVGGQAYIHSSKKIDFNSLADWCRSREGQAIVCENDKATWLPFLPMVTQQVLTGKHSEVIWTNYHTHFNNIQQKLELI